MPAGIATSIETAVDGLLSTFITSKITAVVGVVTPIALSAITIYIMIMGYAVMRGEAHDSLHTILWKLFKISFICGIALSAGEYQATIVDGIQGIQGAITSAFGSATLGGVIDNAAQPYDDLGQQLWSEAVTGVFPNLALCFAAGVVAIAQSLIVVVALGMYLLAKISMALVLAVGPVFIFCAIFPATQKFTEMWVAVALQFAMLTALLAGEISMLYDFTQQFANNVKTNAGTTAIIKDCLALLAVSGGLAVVVLNTQGIAAAMTGGLGLQGIGREIGRAFMNSLGGGKGGGSKGGGEIKGGGSGSGQWALGQTKDGTHLTNSDAFDAARASGNLASSGGNTPLYQRNVIDQIRRASKQ